ncbi:SDR family oxidoreductase [Myroides odoratus]|uniref:SDR family oxidoreductase n=1 Tax=Myroides odoratus TaxID=256 RepID=UPI0039B07EED
MNNKLALITGAAKGLGRHIAIALAKQKIDLILHYNTSKKEMESLLLELEQYEISIFPVQLDFIDGAKVESFFMEKINPILIKRDNKGLDYLINNAGIYEFDYLNKITSDYIDKVFSINFKAPMLLIRDCMDKLNDHGRIINILSTTADRPYKRMIIYGASKAALKNAVIAMISDFGKRGITVNNIIPGLLEQDSCKSKINEGIMNKIYEKNYAIKRKGGVDDVIKLLLFLIKDETNWISGESIEISGGYLYQ